MSRNNKIIVIVGPTASGKSDLGVQLAHRINGEIISADSRQVYKGLDIGSGKITKKEMRGVPHYCLNIASPKKVFTADDFKKLGEKALEQILRKNKIPIIVGGTGFYIDVLLGRKETSNVPPNPSLRKKLEKKSTTQLFVMLQKLDPDRAKTIDQNNPRRLIRAIEIIEATKKQNNKFAVLRILSPKRAGSSPGEESVGRNLGAPRWRGENEQKSKFVILWLGIQMPSDELKKRIHRRLLKRLSGIIREVKHLHQKGISWKRMNDLGLEYRYAAMFAQKQIPKKEMLEKLETEIWHYARRQMTWFRKNTEINWVKSPKEAQKLIKQFLVK